MRLGVELLPADNEQTEQEAKIEEEMAYFVAHHAELRRQYDGQYVAIHHHQVIDHDKDKGVLYLRVGETWGVETAILITEVNNTPIKEFFCLQYID